LALGSCDASSQKSDGDTIVAGGCGSFLAFATGAHALFLVL